MAREYDHLFKLLIIGDSGELCVHALMGNSTFLLGVVITSLSGLKYSFLYNRRLWDTVNHYMLEEWCLNCSGTVFLSV